MKAAVTGWLNGAAKPVRVGAYERKLPSGSYTAFWWWTGEFWAMGGEIMCADCRPSPVASLEQRLPWRGLASDPKASKP